MVLSVGFVGCAQQGGGDEPEGVRTEQEQQADPRAQGAPGAQEGGGTEGS